MKNEKKLFAEFQPSTYREWYAEAEKLLKGAPFEKKMFTKTPEGITLKPIYTKDDIDFETSLPGFDDYVRGTSAERTRRATRRLRGKYRRSLPPTPQGNSTQKSSTRSTRGRRPSKYS